MTHTDHTFAEWEATFDEAPGDQGKYVKIVSNDVFASNFRSLAEHHRQDEAAEARRC